MVSMRSLSWALMKPWTGWPGVPAISPLVFSQVPTEAACCLCQERPRPESPCRTIQFLCQKLCSTSAPQCGWCPEGLGELKLPLLLRLGRCCSTALCCRGAPDLPLEYRQALDKTPWDGKFLVIVHILCVTYCLEEEQLAGPTKPTASLSTPCPPGKESRNAPCPSLVLEGNVCP